MLENVMFNQITMNSFSYGPIMADEIFERLPFSGVCWRILKKCQKVVRFPFLFMGQKFSNFNNVYGFIFTMKMCDFWAFGSTVRELGNKFLSILNLYHVLCLNIWWYSNTNCVLPN